MICACAVDDDNTFTTNHFGDCKFFKLYRVDNHNITSLDSFENTIWQEGNKKGLNISELLRRHKVDVVVSRRFGQNIRQIRTWFYPVLIRVPGCSPDNAVEMIARRFVPDEHIRSGEEHPIMYID
jgi:predicted Fe-Mo cluster-binding NifX family protein